MVEEMLRTPIVPALLRLGLPTMLVLLVQTGVGVAETWFLSFLGTTALTAATVVFPAYMLMTMMANGGIGGGVASAIARALGAGDRARAESLAFHGLVLALAFGRSSRSSLDWWRDAICRDGRPRCLARNGARLFERRRSWARCPCGSVALAWRCAARCR
jgi:hypothetical protein